MATLTFKWQLVGTIGGEEVNLQQPTPVPTVTVTQHYGNTFSATSGTAYTLWDPTLTAVPESLADFDAFYLLSDQAGYIELTCNEDHANERTFAVAVAANLPFVLFSDNGYYNITAAGDVFTTGTVDVIDRLRFIQSSGSAATVRFDLFT